MAATANQAVLPILGSTPQRRWDFDGVLLQNGLTELRRGRLSTLQINVGKLCNQACHHCHVEAGPKRTEIMPAQVAERILELLARAPGIDTVDITGGAPELVPCFRELVTESRRMGFHVIDRCNLTVLFEEGQEDLAQFLAGNHVEIVASLPCYQEKNVDAQRGRGVFQKSLEALRWLNALGYGRAGSGLELNLVYNPVGPYLPGNQQQLEADYKRELRDRFGIEFNRLLTITNMPIKRFAEQLHREGKSDAYMGLLVNHFNPATLSGLMCRSLVSIGWTGHIYDCDFNQMLEMAVSVAGRDERALTIWDIDSLQELEWQRIATADHCFGCTAGAGSSCTGALR